MLILRFVVMNFVSRTCGKNMESRISKLIKYVEKTAFDLERKISLLGIQNNG